MTESALMRQIMAALSADGHFVARAQVGLFWTHDGRPVKSGLPRGFSDLFGHRSSDARAFYLEVKTPSGKVRPEQQAFVDAMRRRGALSAIVRSVEEAKKAISESV